MAIWKIHLIPRNVNVRPKARIPLSSLIGPLVHWLNVKCQMAIRFTFCRSVPPELLQSFLSLYHYICAICNKIMIEYLKEKINLCIVKSLRSSSMEIHVYIYTEIISCPDILENVRKKRQIS